MSLWSLRTILVLSVFLLLRFRWTLCAKIGQLPYCEESKKENPSRSLLFISTLDGKVTALDAAHGGQKKWSLSLNKEALLSSNIHRRDLNSNGQWVRLIPSLNGALYKFDGENLEATPFSTEQLLRSSFRYSDDLVFSGGKETKSYGVSIVNGNILYECNIKGCTNTTDSDNYFDDEILVIQHHQQTVRAVEPRTGIERWNFSVGQHELTLTSQDNSDCHGRKIQSHALDIEIRASVPEGLIWAFSKTKPTIKLWEYAFDSPVVSVWRQDKIDRKGPVGLEEINLFPTHRNEGFSKSPGLYLGMHERQLYIQENPTSIKKIDFTESELVPTYPWQPYPAIESQNRQSDISYEVSDARSTTALSVLYSSEYINGNGFYLFSNDQIEVGGSQCNSTSPNQSTVENMDNILPNIEGGGEEETPVQVIIVSLWYWWKEVAVISIATALLSNFMQKFYHATAVTKEAIMPPLIIERHVIDPKEEPAKSSHDDGDQNFKSRYLTDFEPVDCLGRGGYGVVFEAKNKIDDCNYAIKRIALPNSRDSRERVMREVKALAKLDHHNIVRYFNAWLECPPAGWQEIHDQLWLHHRKFPCSDFLSESSNMESSVHIDVPNSDPPSVDSACEALELNAKDEDSFIIFDAPSAGVEEHHDPTDSEVTQSTQFSASCEDSGDEETDDSIVFENSKKIEISEKKSQMILNLKSKSGSKSNTKMFLYIQMQLCQRLSLREWLKMHNSQRNINKIINIFQQIVDAVEYVHLQGLIHRDLKPSNIFFAYDEKIKIGDFGLVTAMTEGYDEVHTPSEVNGTTALYKSIHTARVGTHLYMSPEQMNGQIYNYKVDIYSLGIILFELLIPFDTEMERVIALTNLRNSTFPDNFGMQFPAEYALLMMMLDKNPDKRPTTLGIKARPPFLKNNYENGTDTKEDSRWHFELPQISRHPSVTSSSTSGDSWENVIC